jgi:glycosyltransferase involved in cell wall biosynthesis
MILQEELAACNAADRVVFLSDEDRSMFADLGFAGGATAFVPVTDAAPLREETHAASKVVCLGHLDWAPNQRGLSWFLEEVWPEVRRRRPDVELLVVGRSLGMTDGAGVTYTGYVDDLLATLRLADVGIVPTLDGTGVKTKTLDLLAAGMPLVATTNGVRGTSAATAGALIADDPDGFTEHLLSLLGDGELRASLSRAGRSALRLQHSQTAVADRLVR